MPAELAIAQRVMAARRRRLGLALMVLLAASACGARIAAGQGLNAAAAPSDSRPIDITADSGIEWQQDKQVYVARGNAVASRGTTQISADTLTAHYRPSKSKSAEGGNEVYRLDADGHVVIKGPTQTVTGDQAVYDVDQQIGVVTGKHLKLTTPTDIVTARDSLEWYDQQQVAVARGDALAIRSDRRIRADILTAHFTKDKSAPDKNGTTEGAAAAKPANDHAATAKPAAPKPAAAGSKSAAPSQVKPAGGAGPLDAGEGSTKISRVDAQGHVVVVTTTDIARGDYGVYNAETGIVTLLGNVSITRGQDTLRGQYAVVDLNRNISRMMTAAAKPGAPGSRVEGLFYRQGAGPGANSGAKPGPKPQPAAAASKS
jgi:lipopolysaccharide export system protein LptA